MYSRDETVNAITAFYQHLIEHPYLPDDTLMIPPSSGWTTIDEKALRAIGKTDTVIDLLRHLPYLCGKNDGWTIAYETVPVAFTIESMACIETTPEYPIPGHCIYITEGLGREGYRLIIDTERGTTTAYSISEYEVTDNNWSYYATLPQTEKWRAHRTSSTPEFFAAWTLRYEKLVWFMCPRSVMSGGESHTRADNRLQEEELCQQDMPMEWIPDYCDAVKEIKELENREWRIRYLKNDADIYNTYMRYGWGGGRFDKQGCKVALVKIEREFWEESSRLSALDDPGDAFFD